MAANLGAVPTERRLVVVNRASDLVVFRGQAPRLWSSTSYIFGRLLGSSSPELAQEDLTVTLSKPAGTREL